MHLVHALETAPQPWRNGTGKTRQIAVGPHDDGEPGWRISLADIDKAGPFSSFPGKQRIFTVAEGELAVLTVGGREHAVERNRPLRFDGGAETSCTLPTGSVRALNVFTDPDRFSAGLLVVELSRKQPLQLADGHVLVLLKGIASVRSDAEDVELSAYDAVLDAGGCTVSGRGFAALISIMDV